jgi:hypothetical protein
LARPTLLHTCANRRSQLQQFHTDTIRRWDVNPARGRAATPMPEISGIFDRRFGKRFEMRFR